MLALRVAPVEFSAPRFTWLRSPWVRFISLYIYINTCISCMYCLVYLSGLASRIGGPCPRAVAKLLPFHEARSIIPRLSVSRSIVSRLVRRRVPNSILWIAASPAEAADYILREVAAAGINPAR